MVMPISLFFTFPTCLTCPSFLSPSGNSSRDRNETLDPYRHLTLIEQNPKREAEDTVSGLSGLLGVTKEVVGIHLLTRWSFAGDILRRSLLHASPAKPTSAPSQF
jgi:hypothetical protein